MSLKMIVVVYLIVMNFVGFFAMMKDKHKAQKGAFRVPEATLFLIALIGGSLGSWAGMYVFHHKTKHWYFVVGMPAILLVQAALGIYLCLR